jgi:predicted amidohydrolase
MQDLKISLIQIDQVWHDKQANLARYEESFQQLSSTDLVVLPEMFHTGFSMDVHALSESMDNSAGISFLTHWSAKLQTAIYASLIIQENGKFYNRGVFVFPSGEITTYDKRKSFGLGGEDKHFSAGEKEVIVEWKGWKINLQICYDLRFPELIRNRMDDEKAAYDVLLYVANWPEKRRAHWDTLLKARSIENQCFVAGVNRVGTDGKELIYSGGTAVYDALGQCLQEAKNHQNDMLQVTLSATSLLDTRKMLPFLKDRS